MKKFLIITVLCGFALSASADDYNYLNFRLYDGTEQSLAANGLKITFSDGSLVATNNGTSTTLDLAQLSAMYFSQNDVSSVDGITIGQRNIRVDNGSVYVAGNQGEEVRIFNISGVLCSRCQLSSDGEELVGESLAAGVYVVKVNNNATKIIVK